MRPGICMECGAEYDRERDTHSVIHCINNLKKERDALKNELAEFKKLENSVYLYLHDNDAGWGDLATALGELKTATGRE